MTMDKAMVEWEGRAFRILFIIFLASILIVPSLAPGSNGATYRADPITVEGNGGFAAAGFTGNGTSEAPYILSEVNLDASFELYGIRIANTTAHFRIEGLTVHDAYSPDRDPLDLSASGSGILLINVTNAAIEDFLGDTNVRGITVVRSSNVTISDSRFNGNIEAGVHVVDCLDGSVKVENSTFTVGDGDDGVLLEGSLGVRVSNNSVTGGVNGIVVRASDMGQGGHLITENAVTGQSMHGILLGGPSLTEGDQVLNNNIRDTGAAGVMISFGTTETVSGNEISGCTQGIVVDWKDNVMSGNVLSNNTQGIVLEQGADRNAIFANHIQDGNVGVWIKSSTGNQVLNNTISRMNESAAAGISLGTGAVSDVLIEGNRISQCYDGLRAATLSGQMITGLLMANNSFDRSVFRGVYLHMTADSRLINNSLLSGGSTGLLLGSGCHGLVIEGNEMSNNTGAGIQISDGDDNVITGNLFASNALEGIYLGSGSGNVIHGNALLFNKGSGRMYSPLRPQAFCGEAGNNWSLGTGNLWADWLSPDVDEDGIVDLPYDLSGGYQDLFPLTSISGLAIPADITPPAVVAHAPQGRDAEQGDAIAITFSEDMNASSVIVMVNNVTKSGIWNDRTFTLDLELEFESDYQVVVMGEDLSGNDLAQFGWAFRTEDLSAEVRGRVVDPDGDPLSGVLVKVGEQESLTNVDGNFVLLLSPGDHILNMSKDGYLDKMVMVHVEPGGDLVLEDSVMEEVLEENEPSGGAVLYAGLAILVVIGAVVVLMLMRRRR